MKHTVAVRIENKEIRGKFELVELIGKIEKMVDEYGTGEKEEEGKNRRHVEDKALV